MKKVVYHGIRDIRVEDKPEENQGRGEVKIKIKYCGICGSDLHEYESNQAGTCCRKTPPEYFYLMGNPLPLKSSR